MYICVLKRTQTILYTVKQVDKAQLSLGQRDSTEIKALVLIQSSIPYRVFHTPPGVMETGIRSQQLWV